MSCSPNFDKAKGSCKTTQVSITKIFRGLATIIPPVVGKIHYLPTIFYSKGASEPIKASDHL